MQSLGIWITCAVALTACHHGAKEPTKQPVDPVAVEQKQLEKLKADNLAKLKSEAADVAQAIVFLEIEAQTRFSLYQTEHPDEAKTGVISDDSMALRLEMGKYLSEMKKRGLHLAPLSFSLKVKGVSPAGEEMNRITNAALLTTGTPSSQPGNISGNIDMLRIFYAGSRSLDATRTKPAPKEIIEISLLAVEACDAILEIYNAKNFNELTALRPDKKGLSNFKRSILTNRKQFAKAANLPTTPTPPPVVDPKAGDPKKNPKDPKTPKDPKSK